MGDGGEGLVVVKADVEPTVDARPTDLFAVVAMKDAHRNYALTTATSLFNVVSCTLSEPEIPGHRRRADIASPRPPEDVPNDRMSKSR